MEKRFAVRLYSPYDIFIVAFSLNKSKLSRPFQPCTGPSLVLRVEHCDF